MANRQRLRIEMLQKEVAVAISNIKVHKDDMPTDAVLPPPWKYRWSRGIARILPAATLEPT